MKYEQVTLNIHKEIRLDKQQGFIKYKLG